MLIDVATKRRRAGSKRSGPGSTREDIDMSAVGRRLRKAREEAGESIVTKLEAACGVGRGTIARIEDGEKPEVSLQVVAKIARFLGIRLDWLVFGDESDAGVGALEELGLKLPVAQLLLQIEKRPGLKEWVFADGGQVPLQLIASGLKTFAQSPPPLRSDGVPVGGWGSWFKAPRSASSPPPHDGPHSTGSPINLRDRRT